jgi:hypothetical protein
LEARSTAAHARGQIRGCSCEGDRICLVLEHLYLARPVARFFLLVAMQTNFYY